MIMTTLYKDSSGLDRPCSLISSRAAPIKIQQVRSLNNVARIDPDLLRHHIIFNTALTRRSKSRTLG